MAVPESHLRIALKSMTSFSNDGKLDPSELEDLLAIAEQDGSIGPDEARVLVGIFDRLQPGELTPEVQARIAQVRRKMS